MESKLREEWLSEPNLRVWNSRSCVQANECNCSKPKLVELWEQDSCIRGRVDTIVCTKCDKVKSFKIIR